MSRSNAAAFDLGLIETPFKDRPALACKACNKRSLDEQYPDHSREYRVLESREQLDPEANRVFKTVSHAGRELEVSGPADGWPRRIVIAYISDSLASSAMVDPQRILISGCCGFKNTGDDALLGLLLATLRERFAAATLCVVAGDTEEVAQEHGVESIHWCDIAAVTEAAKSADLMVLGGGGLFQDYWPVHPENMLSPDHGSISNYTGFAFLAYLTRTPLVIWAVGIGPLRTEDGGRYTRAAFQIATRASVRDEGSLSLLKELGVDTTNVAVGADPVFLLAPRGSAAELIASAGLDPDIPTVMVSVRDWPGAWQETFALGLDRTLASLPGHQVLFVPFLRSGLDKPGDAAPSATILGSMKNAPQAAILTQSKSPAEIAALVSGASLLVAMRFHAVLFGLAHGVPTVAVSYDPKVAKLMASVGAPQSTLDVAEFDAGDFVSTATAAIEHAGRQAVDLDRYRRSAGVHAEIFDDIVPRARPDLSDLMDRLVLDRTLAAAQAIEAQEITQNEVITLRQELEESRAQAQKVGQDLSQSTALAATYSARLYSIERDPWWVCGKPFRVLLSYPLRFLRLARLGLALAKREGIRAALAAAWGRSISRIKTILHASDNQRDLDRILARHQDKPIAVFLPIVAWDIPLFQRPQHIAPGMAKAGFLYFFCTSDGSHDKVNGFREIVPGCILTDQADLVLGIERAKVVHVYSTDQEHSLEAIRSVAGPSDVLLYEYIDEVHGDIHGRDLNPIEIERHEGLLSDPEVVCVTSADRLYQDALSRRSENVALVTNGVDLSHFTKRRDECALPPAMRPVVEKGNPIIGYHGALATWFDYELIIEVATSRPDYEIVLIGVDYDGSMLAHGLEQYPNIHFLGPISYDVLPQHSVYFDVAMIPFRLYELTESTSPIKLFEYMALGLPIVTTALRECQKYESVLIPKEPSDFAATLDRALALRADDTYLALLHSDAQANSWQAKSREIAELMRARLDEQSS